MVRETGSLKGKRALGGASRGESNVRWSQYETDKFFDALRMFGTDFTLIASRVRPSEEGAGQRVAAPDPHPPAVPQPYPQADQGQGEGNQRRGARSGKTPDGVC